MSFQYIGVGIYSLSDASRLTGIPLNSIRRWVLGYHYNHDGVTHELSPIINSQLPALDDSISISFLDLIELRFVYAFRKYGVSWKTIRMAAEKSCEYFKQDHPFACRTFRTDGRSIFAEILHETGEMRHLDLAKGQFALSKIISNELYKGIDFDESGISERWWPNGRKRSVVIDPKRSFGMPVVNKEGVPTSVLASAYKVEESFQRVSKLYDVSTKSVKDAVEFEQQIAA